MRKGIALIITLGVITLISTLVLQNLTTSSEALKQNENPNTIPQSTKILNDIVRFLNETIPQIEDDFDLSKLTKSHIVPYEDFFLDISFTVLSNKLNINHMFSSKINIDKYGDIFLALLTQLEIGSPKLLTNMIIDTIDEDLIAKQSSSEIALKNLNFSNGLIFSHKHFDKILKMYINATSDSDVRKIKWDDLVFFGDINSTYPIYEELQSVLLSKIMEEAEDENPDLNITQKLDIKSFENAKNMLFEVKGNYKIRNLSADFEFLYDSKTKKIVRLQYYK